LVGHGAGGSIGAVTGFGMDLTGIAGLLKSTPTIAAEPGLGVNPGRDTFTDRLRSTARPRKLDRLFWTFECEWLPVFRSATIPRGMAAVGAGAAQTYIFRYGNLSVFLAISRQASSALKDPRARRLRYHVASTNHGGIKKSDGRFARVHTCAARHDRRLANIETGDGPLTVHAETGETVIRLIQPLRERAKTLG
jgi:hypothetical protein